MGECRDTELKNGNVINRDTESKNDLKSCMATYIYNLKKYFYFSRKHPPHAVLCNIVIPRKRGGGRGQGTCPLSIVAFFPDAEKHRMATPVKGRPYAPITRRRSLRTP